MGSLLDWCVALYLFGGLVWVLAWGAYAVHLAKVDFWRETFAPEAIAATAIWPLYGGYALSRRIWGGRRA